MVNPVVKDLAFQRQFEQAESAAIRLISPSLGLSQPITIQMQA